ncbi:MAG TPA: ATP-binding protein [Candidatus Paceibacterota bacterium]
MNLFALSSLLLALVSIGFGVSIYAADRSSRTGRSWLWFTFTFAIWGFGLFGVTTATEIETAIRWQYLLDVGAIGIPFFYLRFVQSSLNVRKMFAEVVAGLGAFVLVALSFTPLYKLGVSMSQFGFYWIQRGPLYFLFPFYFLIIAGYAVLLLIRAYWQSEGDLFLRGQIRNHIIAAAIGFGGGLTDFFPQLFNVYPFGNYFIVLYVVFMAYAVLRYRFFDVKVVSAQFFASALVLATLFNLFNTSSMNSWLLQFGLLVLVSVFSFLLVRSVYHEVEQREKIQRLAEELEQINARQETLIHFVGHEVKGYLAKNMGVFAALAEGDMGELPEEAKPFISEALEQTRAGARSVMSILQASNLKKGNVSYHMAPLDFEELVKKTFAGAQQMAQGKGLTFTLSVDKAGEPYTLTGDADQLGEHVLRNLIENAINYTPQGSVTVSLKKSAEGRVVFAVSDTGVGITDEDKARLFTEGGHGKDSIKVNAHSTGYGLFIAKQIIDTHHGTILAESAGANKGSRFIVELPVVA